MLLIWDNSIYLINSLRGLPTFLWPLLTAPYLILTPLFISLLLSQIIGLAILGAIIFLFKRKQYAIIFILEILLIALIPFTYLKNLSRTVQLMEKFEFIQPSRPAPSGTLDLSLKSLPAGYFLGSEYSEDVYSPGQAYTKQYNANVRMGGDMDIIRFSYIERECDGFYSAWKENVKEATCKAGPCIINDSEFQINDNGACATVFFTALRDNSLTRDEIQVVIDSLERVPGERPKRSFEEMATPAMTSLRSLLESLKKQRGKYDLQEIVSVPLKLSEGNCTSTLNVDIAPDGKSYVIHRPVCPSNGMSYCLENGHDIVQVSTEVIRKTYHCK